MKRKGIFAMFAISLMMALGAAVVAMNWMQEQGGDKDVLADASQVVVAALQVPFGTTVQASDLKLVTMPEDIVPPNSFNDVESVVGRVSNQVIYPGEVVLEGRVSEHMGGSALAALLDPGMRAMSVRVDDVVGVAGFLLPGNRVDVLSSRRNGSRNDVETKTVLRNLKVLAVDQIASQERDGPVIVRAVTLEVTTRQAEELVKATQEGKVQLTLRNPLEQEEDNGVMTAQRSVLNLPELQPREEPASPPRRAAPVQRQVNVIRGTQVSTVNVRN
ncbi:Flp pilus assembly protein CpaB [Halomonas campisalis]|uniref:Flp pilus assembly protein CpaB n=1 Tax=Billgrantia campisalis TaxID=74661 RepID=A0ABS9P6B7_9GAMM|nr:Flp pilus assembly protein CpaB [Halomonas campisalis]MCG6657316.1 Flp pilus assembly protein CpaB [Halomonas campisalis]MDR5864142.1 Flp pilus assembly protein CpaB [Halomonas campisalis]